MSVDSGAPAAEPTAHQDASVLKSVAYRVHHLEAMVGFYHDAFGVEFRPVDARGIRSQFGRLGDLILKFVPIREATEFEKFPLHQLGFEVADVQAVIALARQYGGRQEGTLLQVENGRIHAAVRDPDGNTIELYSRR